MERRFFINDFEQSLKEHADNFQMEPSKKVWHGIYNDLHPGKRWPSVTMSLLLIFTLVVIGHLNTNNSRRLVYLNSNFEATQVIADLHKAGNTAHHQKIVLRKTDLNKGRMAFVYTPGQSNNTPGAAIAKSLNIYRDKAGEDNQAADNLEPANNPAMSSFEKDPALNSWDGNGSPEGVMGTAGITDKDAMPNNVSADAIINSTIHDKIAVAPDKGPQAKMILAEQKTGKENTTKNEIIFADKNAENVSSAKLAHSAAKPHKKRNDRIEWVYFAAPLVSSVSFSGAPLELTQANNVLQGLVGNQKNNKVLHSSALGMEAGTQMNYSLSKKLQFTAGVHLTYSGYNVISNEVHPTPAILVLKDRATGMTYSKTFMTHYGDGTGNAIVTIRNYNWQFSMPFGLQYRVLGNDKLQFNIAANLEPSLVLKSRAYILSSDRNNYINDPDLLRRWNMSSNFGTFITFKSNKFKWQIGPDVRYQWLSTYIKDYTLKEHLIDYGIRIGISR